MGLWPTANDDHLPPMRVSGIQSGNFSGPIGSTVGQQPYCDGLVVREEQPPFWGWTPTGGYLELRATASPRSMVALWLVDLEDTPERCAEICITEMFGKSVVPGKSVVSSESVVSGKSVVSGESVEVGMGLHTFRDPSVPEDFQAPRLPLDPTDFHLYAVDWSPTRADFYIDNTLIRSCPTPPTYPMQLMLAVFDFPTEEGPADHIPEFVVDYIRGYR